jgi:hypothetical protein
MHRHTHMLGWLLIAALSLPLVGCGETETAATGSATDTLCATGSIRVNAAGCTVAGAEAGYRLDITQSANPFPDDRYRDAEGRITPPLWSFAEFTNPDALPKASSNFGTGLLAAIRDNASGWGNFSPLELRLSAEVDPATIAAGLVVLRRDGDAWTVQAQGFTPVWRPSLGLLDLQPLMPLDAATTYAIVVTSTVKTPSGAPLGCSDDFRQVLQREAGAELQPVLDFAATQLGVPRSAIALAFTFTTQETWQDLVLIRDRLDSDELPAPPISFVDVPETRYAEGVFTDGPIKDQLLRGHGSAFRLAAVGTAQLYDFRAKNGVFDPTYVSGAATPPTVRVRIEMAIPDQPMPEGGYPVIILGHGLGQSADFTWDVAEIGAQGGDLPPYVLLAHDFPNHGARGTGNETTDTLRYFHLDNFYAMRDSFRETAAELLEVRRLIETATEPPFNLINKEKILYAGASLGGINGATFLGVDSRVKTALLSVPAGELVRILEGKEVGQVVAPLIASMIGITTTNPEYPNFFRMLIQRGLWIMGAGDSISYAPFIVREHRQLPGATRKSVLIQEGIGDGVLPNATTEDLARVMGVPIVTAETHCDQPGCSVNGMWQYDLADYGLAGEEPHEVSALVREAQDQLLTYLATEGRVITDARPYGTSH